jgi:PAS domain-containing protein
LKEKLLQVIVHPDTEVQTSELFLKKLLIIRGKEFTRVNKWISKNGDILWVEGVIVNLLEDENVRGVVGNYKRYSARKLAEEKTRKC